MRLSTILFGTSSSFDTGGERDGKAAESRLWTRAGLEPSTTELLADPIAILLMQADKLQACEVEALLRHARQRHARMRHSREAGDGRHEMLRRRYEARPSGRTRTRERLDA